MHLRSLRSRKGLIALTCILAIILLYSVNLYSVAYRLTGWKQFGKTPVAVSQIQYFIADTPALIGYTDPASGEMVTCGTTVAYVNAAGDKPYRCCDTGQGILCLAGDYSKEVPAVEEACITRLRDVFGIPDTLPNTKDYKVYGSCSRGAANITVAQLDPTGTILWKTILVNNLDLVNSALRCILAPLLLGLAIWAIFTTIREKKTESIPKF